MKSFPVQLMPGIVAKIAITQSEQLKISLSEGHIEK